MKTISVSIITGDPQTQINLGTLIQNSPGLCCVSQHGSAESALAELAAAHPDVILMDVRLPGMDGIECVRRLRPILPATQVIMLTDDEAEHMEFHALAAGAIGYLFKQTSPGELLAAIREAHAGGSPMNSRITRKLVQTFQRLDAPPVQTKALSPRQTQVHELLIRGYRYQEIAGALQISYTTVHTHVRHIYKKLQVHSRAQVFSKCLGQTRWETSQLTRAGTFDSKE